MRLERAILLVWIAASVNLSLNSAPSSLYSFDFSPECQQAYKAIISLHIRQGNSILKRELERSPENLLPYYIASYGDFLTVYTSERTEDFELLKENAKTRLKQLKKGKEDSPYYLFTQAEIYLQTAILKIKYTEYVSGIFDIRRSVKLLEKNQRLYPDFLPNKKSLGLLYTVLGSVPDKYRFGLAFLGIDSEVEEGMALLDEVLQYAKTNPEYIYNEEVITIYAFIQLHLQNEQQAAWETLRKNNFPQSNNLMNVFSCAHIGVFSGNSDAVVDILNNRPTDTSLADFPYLDYLSGLAKLNSIDQDADGDFKKFIENTSSEYHIKAAYQKLAWHSLIFNEGKDYSFYMQKVMTNGNHLFDADKQAQSEAEDQYKHNSELLKARLLSDGGFYERALAVMKNIDPVNLESEIELTEYHYRSGRIWQQLDKLQNAISDYEKTLVTGKELDAYFAANASLQLGYIYREMNNKSLAEQYFKTCLNMKDHEYKNGIDQKARAALSALKD